MGYSLEEAKSQEAKVTELRTLDKVCLLRPRGSDGALVAVNLLSRVRLFVTSWTLTHQPPLSVEFSRQEYWSG